MSTPDPIGPIRFSEPRAVKVRDPQQVSTIHSAVHGEINVGTDTVLETQAVLAAWRVIMQAAADKAEEIISAVRVNNEGGNAAPLEMDVSRD